MKTKNLSKKLTLNKKSIANLDNNGMNAVKGGESAYCGDTVTCHTLCDQLSCIPHKCPMPDTDNSWLTDCWETKDAYCLTANLAACQPN